MNIAYGTFSNFSHTLSDASLSSPHITSLILCVIRFCSVQICETELAPDSLICVLIHTESSLMGSEVFNCILVARKQKSIIRVVSLYAYIHTKYKMIYSVLCLNTVYNIMEKGLTHNTLEGFILR